jgi:outer membrane lipoprotein-sorting protein
MVTKTAGRRWAVPAVVASVAVGLVVAPHAAAASPHPSLPTRSPAALLAAVEQSNVQHFSGTVRTIANLGLPQLPDRFSASGSGLQALLAGTHQLRVWADGPDRQRVALLGDLAETDVTHNGSDIWTYSSQTSTVSHQTLPAHRPDAAHPEVAGSASPEQQLTPQAQADKALKAIDPTTIVSVDRTARVAGRAAYQLVLTPRTSKTLIRSVRIAVDAATSLPLRVEVFAVGSSKPALQTGFTRISFRRPGASMFRFTAPAGATVSPSSGSSVNGKHADAPDNGSDPTHATGKPRTVGTGWATILELPAGTVDAKTTSMVDRMTTAVPQGRLLRTRLLTALITPDGRVFVGAVPATAVEQAATA